MGYMGQVLELGVHFILYLIQKKFDGNLPYLSSTKKLISSHIYVIIKKVKITEILQYLFM